MTKSAEQDVVIVTASRDRWRIGRLFKAKEPVPLEVADLSETELQRLEGDPVLSLRFGTSDATADDQTGKDEDAGAAIIKAVLEDLTPEDFNKDGSPKVAAIEAAIDRELSKADVTAALAGLTDAQRDTLKARLEASGA